MAACGERYRASEPGVGGSNPSERAISSPISYQPDPARDTDEPAEPRMRNEVLTANEYTLFSLIWRSFAARATVRTRFSSLCRAEVMASLTPGFNSLPQWFAKRV